MLSSLTRFASGNAGAMLLSGSWLYAVTDGKLCTFDVSAPEFPRLTSQTPAAGNRQMVKSGNCLYLSCRALGVQVFSLEDPENPKSINRFYPTELATGLAVSGNVLAVTLRIYGVEFFDISDPLNVRSLSLLRTGEAQSAAFFGENKIAIGDWGTQEVVIGDISDLRHPRIISRHPLGGYGDGVAIRGKYLYAATGKDAPGADSCLKGNGHGLEIFDISDVCNPVLTGKIKFDTATELYPDWWSVHVSGNTAFVTDISNGVYVVDVNDKSHPVVRENVRLPDDAASQLAVGDGVIYVSGEKTGLYCFKNSDAQIQSPEDSFVTLPDDKTVESPQVPGLENLPLPGFVWSLAAYDSTLYAACGSAGLKEFELVTDGKPVLRREYPGTAMDCAVSEKLLIVAAESKLLIFDRKSGELLSSTTAEADAPFLQLRLFGDTLCTASRGVTFRMWDLSHPERPRLTDTIFRGGGILYHDMLPERCVNGLFPVNWHTRTSRWYNAATFEEICVLSEDFRRCSQQSNGITEIDGKFYLVARKGVLCLDPAAPENPVLLPMTPLQSGIPSSDGKQVAISDRSSGRVAFYNFDGKSFNEIRHYDLSFAVPGRILLHNNKAYIPAGLNGIYFEA